MQDPAVAAGRLGDLDGLGFAARRWRGLGCAGIARDRSQAIGVGGARFVDPALPPSDGAAVNADA
jgi:hypothetical protein